MGLLYDILHALAETGANLREAEVRTRGELARDVFRLVDEQGRKLVERGRLRDIRQTLQQAIRGGE